MAGFSYKQLSLIDIAAKRSYEVGSLYYRHVGVTSVADIQKHSLYGLKIAAWGIFSAVPAVSGWAFFGEKTVPLYILFALITFVLFVIGYLFSMIISYRSVISQLQSKSESAMRPRAFTMAETGMLALCNRVPYLCSGNSVSFYYQNTEYDTYLFDGIIQLVNDKGYFQIVIINTHASASELSERAFKNDRDIIKNIIVRPKIVEVCDG